MLYIYIYTYCTPSILLTGGDAEQLAVECAGLGLHSQVTVELPNIPIHFTKQKSTLDRGTLLSTCKSLDTQAQKASLVRLRRRANSSVLSFE